MAYRRTQGCSRYAQAPSVHVEIPHEETRPDQSVGLYTATPEVKRTLADRGMRVGCRGSDVGRVYCFSGSVSGVGFQCLTVLSPTETRTLKPYTFIRIKRLSFRASSAHSAQTFISIISVKTRSTAWAPSLKHRWHFISDLHFRSLMVFSRARGSSNIKRLSVFCMDTVQMDAIEVSYPRYAHPSLSGYLFPFPVFEV